MTANQIRITGPNSHPTAPVPWRWMANRPTRIPSEIGTTRCDEARVDDLEALDRRGDRDRRGDHAVAEEQAGAEDAERDEQRRAPDLAALDQRGQRHDAAVAAVVRAHDEARVLDRDDDDQRPEDQRHDPVHARDGRVGRGGVLGEDHLLGVQRAGADVAVDDAQRAERQHDRARRGRRRRARRSSRPDAPGRRRWPWRRDGGDRPRAELVGGLVEAAAHAGGPAGAAWGSIGRRSASPLGSSTSSWTASLRLWAASWRLRRRGGVMSAERGSGASRARLAHGCRCQP